MAEPKTIEKTLPDAVKEAFASLGGVQKKPAIASWINEHYPDIWKDSSLITSLYASCVNSPNAIRHHPTSPRFLFYHGHTTYELYDPSHHGSFDEKGYVDGEAPEEKVDLNALVSEELVQA